MSNTTATEKFTLITAQQLIAQQAELIASLTARIEKLENKDSGPKSDRDMTDEDAVSILYGDNKSVKHKEVAEKMNLSYGQVYSCRLGYTFKHIHKQMKEKGIENIWMKK